MYAKVKMNQGTLRKVNQISVVVLKIWDSAPHVCCNESVKTAELFK